MRNSLDVFEFRPDSATDYIVTVSALEHLKTRIRMLWSV